MRFLCLHGLGTSSDVLKTQIASLRYQLGEQEGHEFEFIDGAVLWPPARGIREVFGDEVESFSYFDESADSIMGAVGDLAQYIDSHGPFDGVIGFSQGAVLAATLIIAQQDQAQQQQKQSATHGSRPVPQSETEKEKAEADADGDGNADGDADGDGDGNVDPSGSTPVPLLPRLPPFRCAVFLCGGLPFAWDALTQGRVELITPSSSAAAAEPLVHIPVVNCWAAHDEDYPGMGPPLSQLCAQEINQQVVHGVGHAVPTEGPDLMALVAAVQATLSRA